MSQPHQNINSLCLVHWATSLSLPIFASSQTWIARALFSIDRPKASRTIGTTKKTSLYIDRKTSQPHPLHNLPLTTHIQIFQSSSIPAPTEAAAPSSMRSVLSTTPQWRKRHARKTVQRQMFPAWPLTDMKAFAIHAR